MTFSESIQCGASKREQINEQRQNQASHYSDTTKGIGQRGHWYNNGEQERERETDATEKERKGERESVS